MYHKWQSYDVWFLRYGMQRTESFAFLERFLLFHSPNPENKNFEKIKITPGDVIILHMCTINNNHKMCGSCDIEGNKHNSLSFWTIFYPFTPLLIQKINILKKWKKKKKYMDISSFYKRVTKTMIICYTVPEMWCVADAVFIFHVGLFFALLPP